VQVPHSEDIAKSHCPRVMRGVPRGACRSVDRGAHRPAIEPRKVRIQGADMVYNMEGNTTGRVIASVPRALRGRRTWHVCTLFVWEPGDLQPGQEATPLGPHREGEEP
jgi:hypothetical protein